MRLFVLTMCAGAALAVSASARTLQIHGVAGYLGEYELAAEVSGEAAGAGSELLSSPLQVKHIGLCTHEGPDVILGELQIRFAGLAHRVEAKLNYGGRACRFDGFLSQTEMGVMSCDNRLTLPIWLWPK